MPSTCAGRNIQVVSGHSIPDQRRKVERRAGDCVMELTKEERERVKAHIGEMLNGKSANNATNEEMKQAVIELMSLTYCDWQRRFG